MIYFGGLVGGGGKFIHMSHPLGQRSDAAMYYLYKLSHCTFCIGKSCYAIIVYFSFQKEYH